MLVLRLEDCCRDDMWAKGRPGNGTAHESSAELSEEGLSHPDSNFEAVKIKSVASGKLPWQDWLLIQAEALDHDPPGLCTPYQLPPWEITATGVNESSQTKDRSC
ncbi:hypothetical protein CB1_000705018 [Camelus ferus]|nr:hypothetical protein CB1_000705018 [Camelus ferus]